jgi:hypothetical protein
MTMTLLIAPLIGIASALLTILVTPTLQHYFWRRQRSAELQLAVIDEMRTLAAELAFLVSHQPEEISIRRERLFGTLFRVATSTSNLFSEAAYNHFRAALQPMENILSMEELSLREQRTKLYNQIVQGSIGALKALYEDMGIPPTSPRQWMREHAWQPLRGLVWACRQRAWHERGWLILQRWGAQVRTRIHRW